ncbi:MAG: hypothetical protein V1660_04130, partial [archaeon]
MVDYHYVKRGGKLYGPYYYKSYRVGNKVKKQYLGKVPPKGFGEMPVEQSLASISKKSSRELGRVFSVLFLFSVLVFGVVLLSNMQLSGHVVMDLPSSTIKPNEAITGTFNLLLKSGELIPKDSIVKVKIDNIEKEIPLSEFLKLS